MNKDKMKKVVDTYLEHDDESESLSCSMTSDCVYCAYENILANKASPQDFATIKEAKQILKDYNLL